MMPALQIDLHKRSASLARPFIANLKFGLPDGVVGPGAPTYAK